jgi:dynein heavy chain
LPFISTSHHSVADIVLFNGIVTDLFPGLEAPSVDYGLLNSALCDASRAKHLQPTDYFLLKCIQLFETTVVRHGLMLVGPTGGSKTTIMRTLADAMGRCKGHEGFDKVEYLTLNPKAVTMGQLYGQFDPNTHEWTDGIASCLVRKCADDKSTEKKWVVFDGPVDAIWIENMNTVLDDNKA